VVNQSLILRINICGKNRHLRQAAKRYAQCRGTDSVLRTLALLFAALSHATPKQAKEPRATKLYKK
jgi:hypothetical protein